MITGLLCLHTNQNANPPNRQTAHPIFLRHPARLRTPAMGCPLNPTAHHKSYTLRLAVALSRRRALAQSLPHTQSSDHRKWNASIVHIHRRSNLLAHSAGFILAVVQFITRLKRVIFAAICLGIIIVVPHNHIL